MGPTRTTRAARRHRARSADESGAGATGRRLLARVRAAASRFVTCFAGSPSYLSEEGACRYHESGAPAPRGVVAEDVDRCAAGVHCRAQHDGLALVAVLAFRALSAATQSTDDLARANRAQHFQQDADMYHDGLRAYLYAAALAGDYDGVDEQGVLAAVASDNRRSSRGSSHQSKGAGRDRTTIGTAAMLHAPARHDSAHDAAIEIQTLARS